MASGWNHDNMNLALARLMLPGEQSLCPVYCMFKDTGFFARQNSMIMGYATCTNTGRFLYVQNRFGQWTMGACALKTATKIKMKKTIFGQMIIEIHFPTDKKKDAIVKIQVAPKIYGYNFPNQRVSFETMQMVLEKYQL